MPSGALSNGHDGDQEPRDELYLHSNIVAASDGNPLLNQSNLGLGNYTEGYLWQQVRSYRKGLYAYIAFGNILTDRVLHETKLKLGRDGYVHYDENQNKVKTWDEFDPDEHLEQLAAIDPDHDCPGDDCTCPAESSWTAIERRGESIWDSLGEAPEPVTKKQVSAVIKKTGVEPGKWLPMFWQMVAGRHDVSRSLEAELLRDFLTDTKRLQDDAESEEARSLLKRSTSRRS